MNSCMSTCVIFRLIGLQVGCTGAIVETLLSYEEFPCCFVGGHLDSVGAVVYIYTHTYNTVFITASQIIYIPEDGPMWGRNMSLSLHVSMD
jgi:hypothetical protein